MQHKFSLVVYASLLVVSLVLVSCSADGLPEPVAPEIETLSAETPANEPTLLGRYSVLSSSNIFGDEVRNYDAMIYRPRHFESGFTLTPEDPGPDEPEEGAGEENTDEDAEETGGVTGGSEAPDEEEADEEGSEMTGGADEGSEEDSEESDEEGSEGLDEEEAEDLDEGVARDTDEGSETLVDLKVDDAGEYEGWDLLTTPENPAFFGGIAEGEKWLELTLTRDARLGVVWGEGKDVPGWLESWTEGEEVELGGDGYRVYEQDFGAGEVTLPAPAPSTNYHLLLAEEGGEPSDAPSVPEGEEEPEVGQPCPAWVHDQYQAEGPDGQLYPSWHPQIDPVYTCTFGHEHGSNPDLLPGDHEVVFGYVADKLDQDESNEGFKNFIMEDGDGNTWMLTVHGKTSSVRRYCTQFHTVKVKVVDPEGELLADLHYKGDFGHSRNADSDVIQPQECDEDQEEIKRASPFTAKSFPDADGEGVDGLEQWLTQVHTDVLSGAESGNLLGLATFSYVMYFINPALLCTDDRCENTVTKSSGERRYLIPVDAPGIDANRAAEDGTFYTDPYGNELRSEDDDDAVEQFVKPDLDVRLTGNIATTCIADDAFDMAYSCDGNAAEPLNATPDMNLENALINN